jgi:hypothetical protein
MIAASDSRIVAFDNLSKIPEWLSDGLCRLASGGAIGKRELYSDGEEYCLEAQRPVILTGIEELAARGDLIDRTIVVNLPALKERRTEEEVLARFEEVRPGALGALLDAASMALRNRASTSIPDVPRLADFATWNAAGAPALGVPGDFFLGAYRAHRRDNASLALDADKVSGALVTILDQGDFSGTVGGLLDRLEEVTTPGVVRSRLWPKSPKELAGHLRRIAPDLRKRGIGLGIGKRTSKGVQVTLSRVEPEGGEHV